MKPKRGERIAKRLRSLVPTSRGKDIVSRKLKIDGHVRLERHGGPKIMVDLFDSRIRDPGRAHIESEMFGYSKRGAEEASRYLQGNGFNVRVVKKR